jgi:hypothetical protein
MQIANKFSFSAEQNYYSAHSNLKCFLSIKIGTAFTNITNVYVCKVQQDYLTNFHNKCYYLYLLNSPVKPCIYIYIDGYNLQFKKLFKNCYLQTMELLIIVMDILNKYL